MNGLALSFSIEIHFCSKLSPNIQLSATFLTIHIKFEQDRLTSSSENLTIAPLSALHVVKRLIKAHNSVTNL